MTEAEKKTGEIYPPKYGAYGRDLNEENRKAYMEGYEAGKADGSTRAIDQLNALPKVKAWVARDKFQDKLVLFNEKPYRPDDGQLGIWKLEGGGVISLPMSRDFFPELKWEDEPIEVEIHIVKK